MSLPLATVLLLGALYTLPDEGGLPAPDETQAARIEAALVTLRSSGEEEEVDRAVRELALVGEPALSTVLARLNEAEAGERLLLLAAVSRLPRATPLLAQAKGDPHAAVRAWVATPPRDDPDLELLCKRYLQILAIAEAKASDDARQDLQRLEPERWGPLESELYPRQLIGLRERMKDRRYADGIHRRRLEAAMRFAMRGGAALRSGELKPSASDPIFLAYLALLREESGAFYHALTALVEVGEPVAPILADLLNHDNHEPRKLVRILSAVRPDSGRILYEDFELDRPEVQSALVEVAAEILEPEALVPFLESAATVRASAVRAVALDELLELDAPAGAKVANELFDLELYGRAEFDRAARLLARAGDFAKLVELAPIQPPRDDSVAAEQIRQARRAALKALKETRTPEVEALGLGLLDSENPLERNLGLELVRDPKRLLDAARAEEEASMARFAAQRALEEGGAGTAPEAVRFMRERKLDLPFVAWDLLTRTRSTEALIELAGDPDVTVARRAMHRLSLLPSIDAGFEAALFKLRENAPERLRDEMLGALLPLGTPAVEELFSSEGENALRALRSRAQSGGAIRIAFPVEDYLDTDSADRLSDLGLIVQSLATVREGIYSRLILAFDRVKASETDDQDTEASPARQQEWLLDALARSTDVTSAKILFERLLAKKEPRFHLILGTLKAAARHLPPEDLAKLVPILQRHVEAEYPLDEKVQPVFDPIRRRMLWGGINALAWKQVEAGLPFLCDTLLDPRLQPSAFDWITRSAAPAWSREALRHFPAVTVNTAIREAIQRAEADGRLAKMEPSTLFEHARACQLGRDRGRRLNEVGVALLEVLERLPWEGAVGYEKMKALGGLKRYADAAAAARDYAGLRRRRSFSVDDDYWSVPRMLDRGRLYESLAGGDPAGFAWVEENRDPLIIYVAGFYLRYFVKDAKLATHHAERAVRLSAGLYHPFRDLLAAQLTSGGDPKRALRLLDPLRRLPVKRPATGNLRHLMYLAQTRLALGEVVAARRDIESALTEDKRLLPEVLADPRFQQFADLFQQIDDEYLDYCFRWGD